MVEQAEVKIPKRILNTLIASLAAGVVPRSGAPYIAIGRNDEIAALLENLETVADGGAFCRFLIGRYGSGKSFLIQLIRSHALERGFLTADADLSPERRLTGGNGAGLATYRELIAHLASSASPEGGALPLILSRYFVSLKNAVIEEGTLPGDPAFATLLQKKVYRTLAQLEGDVGGFDFARVLAEYYLASLEENEERKSACLRFLRGEFITKTEAKNALGFQVSHIIGDDNWYEFIKLFAALSVKIGYKGLLLFVDECVNLYKIPNRISREANYEKLLAIFNDTLQGKAKSIGVVIGGVPQFLEDTRRGLFSYEALRSRLCDSRYTELGYRNLASPVIRLRRLSDNELYALVVRLYKLYVQKEGDRAPKLSQTEIENFMSCALGKIGAEDMVTPREIIRDFLTLLNILRDNPDATFDALVRGMKNEAAQKNMTVNTETASGASSEEQANSSQKKTVTIFDIEI